jgi:cytochrome c-type biogenesis protein
MTAAALISAFAAGLVSFLSPCVLPLVPVYLAQLVGPTVWEGQRVDGTGAAGVSIARTASWRGGIAAHAAAFVAGFGVAFVALGATASALGSVLAGQQELLRHVGGVVLVVFGLHVAGVVRVPGLQRDLRLRLRLRTGGAGYATSLGLGIIFALGWTPCVGPYLGSILVLAAQARTLGAGVGLLAVYALGLGLPFLVAGLAFDRIAPALRRLSPHLGAIERVAGVLLVALGVAIFFNWLLVINSRL